MAEPLIKMNFEYPCTFACKFASSTPPNLILCDMQIAKNDPSI